MATTKNPSYFSNLKTPAANMAYGTGINVFNAVSKGASSAGKISTPGPTQAELEKQRNEEIVARNLETAPQIDFSMFPDLPQSMREKIMDLVKNKGAERGYMTHMQQNSGDTDFIGKSELTQQIGINEDLIKNHIPNQLKKLQAKFEGFNEDANNDMVSAMMSSEDKAFISDIVSGNIIPDLDENGNMSFNGMTIDELPGVELTNYEAGSAMLQNFTSAYDNGILLTENQQALARTNFKQSLGKFSDNDLLSTGFEDVMSLGSPLLNQADYQDQINALRGNDPTAKIQAKKDLKLAIENAYMDKLNQQAQDGFDFKQSKKNNKTTTKTSTIGGVEGYGSEDGNVEVWNFYSQYDFGYDAVSFDGKGNIDGFDLKEHLGDRPEISDLGIYLASSGYNLTEITPVYVDPNDPDGDEMDKPTAMRNALAQFTPEDKAFYYAQGASDADKLEILRKYLKPVKQYGLSPRKLKSANTKEERNRYTFNVDPNSPRSIQIAINKLSKLN